MNFRFIIVGSGFSGSTVAHQIASELNENVLVIEKRNHIGGNCYDFKNEHGIIIHRYGPHLFHTDNERVFNYLSRFTEWYKYEHKPLAYVDGKKIPIPFNFHTVDAVFPYEADRIKTLLISEYGENKKIAVLDLLKNKNPDIRRVAEWVYEKIFKNYTAKQWGKKPEEIDPSVTARVPIYTGYDSRYFHDKYQFMPSDGYSAIFKKMLSLPKIKLVLNTDYRQLIKIDFKTKKIYFDGSEFKGKLIFSGMIDELCNFIFGRLSYRTLDFEFVDYRMKFFQEAAIVNYPNDYSYTRITEFKHIHPANTDMTTVAYEYPRTSTESDIPYYPFFTDECKSAYERYRDYLKDFKNIILIGRLAEYRYYDMDDAVMRALELFDDFIKK